MPFILLLLFLSASMIVYSPVLSITNKKVIYLTFDDGPSSIVTNDILNCLKEHRVKATFFVVGSSHVLNNAFLKKLHDKHFKIYDWNASISDGVKPKNSAEAFAREAITSSSGISYIVFLMHCNNINVNTYKALPQIIQHYKKQGYEFRTITSDTPEFYWHPSS